MGKKLLIDATHAEETRVVVVDGNKVEEFDFETIHKRQLAGNIYLAKVTRVEPSLQAAFVDYGGNRHGFLAFAEIHPDYYQIPVADREALLAEERELARASEEARDDEGKGKDAGREAGTRDSGKDGAKDGRKTRRRRSRSKSGAEDAQTAEAAPDADQNVDQAADTAVSDTPVATAAVADAPVEEGEAQAPAQIPTEAPEPAPVEAPQDTPAEAPAEAPVETPAESPVEVPSETPSGSGEEAAQADEPRGDRPMAASSEGMDQRTYGSMDVVDLEEDADADKADKADVPEDDPEAEPFRAADVASERDDQIESVADEDVSDEVRPPRRPRAKRYKIQEVIKVRQIMLVQVVKEERGNKGAALTTYLSLAGRYCVLMPNTARGGGISRKITNAADRKKLKDIASEFDVPEGAGLIIRTAGANRTKTEIKRDYEYLFRLWEQIRELTLKSIAPAPIYEEGNLIKRSIRDLYNKDIDEVLVEGPEGYRTAKDFMKMIMPSHAKNVKLYSEPMPLFARYQVESYLGSMFNPTVQLKSGGYIVIGVTEALVAIDVNSGKSTREGSIEDTALKTNLEAAEEVARQLRLRDLAGLIVIDFIDMEERKNNNAVEKRLKDALRNDRARIQVGRISGFGLLEMSRQRLRPGMIEVTTQPCPHCHGTGLIRSDNSLALQILRALEEEGTRNRSKEVLVKAPTGIVNYLFNAKREHVAQIEARYGMAIRLEADPSLVSPDYVIEKFKTATRIVAAPTAPVVSLDARTMSDIDDALEDEIDEDVASDEVTSGDDEDGKSDGGKRKRRRRRRSRKGGQNGDATGDTGGDANGEAGETQGDAREEAGEGAQGAETDSGTSPDDVKPEAAPTPRKRRSRSRKKPVEAKDAESGDLPAETAAETTAETGTEVAQSPVAEPDAEPDAAAGPVAEAAGTAGDTATGETTVTASDAGPEAEAVDVATPTAEVPPEDDTQAEAAVQAEDPDMGPDAPQPAESDPEPTAGDATEPTPAKPRRTGWWSRGR